MTDASKPSPWFWQLLASSQLSLPALCRQLEQLPKEQLRRYHFEYEAAKDAVNPSYRPEFYAHLAAECSEDHGDDFAAWVVMQGRAFFEQVLAHPEQMQRHLDLFAEVESGHAARQLRWDNEVDRPEYRGYQRADYIAWPIYQLRFGERLPDTDEGSVR
jgi:hypothetical protein